MPCELELVSWNFGQEVADWWRVTWVPFTSKMNVLAVSCLSLCDERLLMSLIHGRFLCLVVLSTLALFTDNSSAQNADELKKLIEKVRPSVATIRVEGRDGGELGIGTGFLIAGNLVATNYHVINEGRKFTIELSTGEKLKPLAIEASDRTTDLVLIRVDVPDDKQLPALQLAESLPEQGNRVLVFGNPLGLEHSLVDGIVSAVREVQGQKLIQLAIPIEKGNSGGPLVDRDGRVLGIVNMKSAIEDNLGFAIPIEQLELLRDNPNPVSMNRWVRLGTINGERWQPIMGATWQERGGIVSARGMGKGFGGRSLCLSQQEIPKTPFEIAVLVKLDDESGAAGLAFYSDEKDKHYGFYPSNGRLRLTCFKGATVYSWQVLEEIESEFYLPGQWNRLRVRVEENQIQCFVNGHLVVTTKDKQLTTGKVGLVKFRNTNPDFKRFAIGENLEPTVVSKQMAKWLDRLDQRKIDLEQVKSSQVQQLGQSSDASVRELMRRATILDNESKQMRRLAEDLKRVPTLAQLKELYVDANENKDRLLTATLLVAQLDNPDIDISFYKNRVDVMAGEIRADLEKDADQVTRRKALDNYLFKQNGFHAGRSEYYHVANSHLDRVIDDREGLPITMSILYMELGRRLEMRIDGVGLPGRFIVNHVISDKDDDNQLIDVFDGGKLLSKADASELVREFANRTLQLNDLRAQDDREILTRVLSNLMGIATRNEDLESMLRYIEAMVVINPEAVDFRMMRVQLRGMTDRKSRAIEDIDWLLEKAPEGIDYDRLEAMRSSLQK